MMTTVIEPTPTSLSPEPLYQLAMGFTGTRTLLAAHRLKFFESLAQGPKTAKELANEQDLSETPTEMLLDACASLQLLTKSDDRYSAGPLVHQFLVKGNGPYLGHFLDHFHDHIVPAWAHLEETVRSGRPQMHHVIGHKDDPFFQAIDRSSKDLDTFMWTMEEHSLLEGEALANVYDFSNHRILLDVAGGTGAMSVAIVKRYPHLRAVVLERPSACAAGAPFILRHGLADQIQMQEGDMFRELPREADILLLSGTLHNWGPSDARKILHQCYQALPPGGTLLISEQILDERKTASPLGPLCSLNMFVMMGGREYSYSEYAEMLSETGFTLKGRRPTGGVRQLLIALRR